MTSHSWLALNEYSNKYHVSLSTLRRRIRANEVRFQFQDGKYWLFDAPLTHHQRQAQAPAAAEPVVAATHAASVVTKSTESHLEESQAPSESTVVAVHLMKSAQQLMHELKSAYVSVLHEKEEQIMQLKKENADLKTLVQILEGENDRLKHNLNESAPIDSWLEKNL